MFIRDLKNEYGTPITEFRCGTCGELFTICPKVSPCYYDQWEHCILEHCDSYDPSRDADILFMGDEELVAKKILSIDMLRARRNGVRLIETETNKQ